MQKLIDMIPQAALYPVGWYLTAEEWIAKNPGKTFWLWLATIIAALVF